MKRSATPLLSVVTLVVAGACSGLHESLPLVVGEPGTFTATSLAYPAVPIPALHGRVPLTGRTQRRCGGSVSKPDASSPVLGPFPAATVEGGFRPPSFQDRRTRRARCY